LTVVCETRITSPQTSESALDPPRAGSAAPNRFGDVMDVRFDRIVEGKRIFQVLSHDGESSLFSGTNAQCRRFIEVHLAKLDRDRRRERRSRRSAEARR
jgi:hypothetical protein